MSVFQHEFAPYLRDCIQSGSLRIQDDNRQLSVSEESKYEDMPEEEIKNETEPRQPLKRNTRPTKKSLRKTLDMVWEATGSSTMLIQDISEHTAEALSIDKHCN